MPDTFQGRRSWKYLLYQQDEATRMHLQRNVHLGLCDPYFPPLSQQNIGQTSFLHGFLLQSPSDPTVKHKLVLSVTIIVLKTKSERGKWYHCWMLEKFTTFFLSTMIHGRWQPSWIWRSNICQLIKTSPLLALLTSVLALGPVNKQPKP